MNLINPGKLKLSVDTDGLARIGSMRLFTDDEAALELRIDSLVRQGGTHLVVTPNVDQVIDLEHSEPLQVAFAAAALRLIDGMPLRILALLLGAKNPHRHTGADLLPLAVKWAGTRDWKVAIAGGSDLIAREAAHRLRGMNPGVEIVTVSFPHIHNVADQRSKRIIDELNSLKPDLVFLCLGAPKQESWFMYWRELLPDGVYVGAGAAVDFAAGYRSRAPKLVQNLGCEWLWRLMQEPSRLAQRYLVKGPRFLKFTVASLKGSRK